jgi:hypothetical protein
MKAGAHPHTRCGEIGRLLARPVDQEAGQGGPGQERHRRHHQAGESIDLGQFAPLQDVAGSVAVNFVWVAFPSIAVPS